MKKGHYNNIKGVLGTLGVKSDELAEGLKVNPVTVSRWCTNDAQPSLERLYEIAEFLGVPTTDLIFAKLPSSPARKK
jgi:putative transcriptional regulator